MFYVEVPNTHPRTYELTDTVPLRTDGRWAGYQFAPTLPFIVHSKMYLHQKLQTYVVRGVSKNGRLLVQTHALTDPDANWDEVGRWHEVECGDTAEGYRFKRYALKPLATLIKLATTVARDRARVAAKAAKLGDRAEKCGVCPVCFGDYVVNRTAIAETRKGSILTSEKFTMVHHGYERPGVGYIVGDCHGVGFEPFEISCEGTKSWLNQLHGALNYRKEALRQLDTRDEIAVDIKARRNFRTGRTEIEKKILKRGEEGFDRAIELRRNELTTQIASITHDIAEYGKRIAEWKPAQWPRARAAKPPRAS